MTRMKSEYLGLFLDGSLNFFIRSVFIEQQINQKIMYAGILSEQKYIQDEELPKLVNKVRHDKASRTTSNTKTESEKQYDLLVDSITNYAGSANQAIEAWKAQKEDFLRYFSRGFKIYADIGGVYNKKGYYLSDTGVLKYYEGIKGGEKEICTLGQDAKALFFPLFNKGVTDNAWIRQRSMNLTPDLFIQLVERAPDNANFFVPKIRTISSVNTNWQKFPADKSLISLYRKCEQHYSLKSRMQGSTVITNAEDFAESLAKDLTSRADSYILGKKADDPKVEVMQAIKDYFDPNNKDSFNNKIKFAEKIKSYDTGWFAWFRRIWRVDEVDRALSIIKAAQSCPHHKFFDKAVGNIKVKLEKQLIEAKAEAEAVRLGSKTETLRTHLTSAFDLKTEKTENFDNFAKSTSEIWKRYKVDKKDFLKALEMLSENLEKFDTNSFPKVSLPKKILGEVVVGDNDEYTVVDHLKKVILLVKASTLGIDYKKYSDELETLINLLGGYNAPAAVEFLKNKSELYKTRTSTGIDYSGVDYGEYSKELAYIANKIVETLRFHYLDNESRQLISHDNLEAYNELLSKLSDVLINVSEPKIQAEIKVSAATIKNHIAVLQRNYAELRKLLEEKIAEIKELYQYELANPLYHYLSTDFKKKEDFLKSSYDKLDELQTDEFNILAEPQAEYQEKVLNILKELSFIGTEITDTISTIIKQDVKIKVNGADVNRELCFDDVAPRSYKKFSRGSDKSMEFDKIIKELTGTGGKDDTEGLIKKHAQNIKFKLEDVILSSNNIDNKPAADVLRSHLNPPQKHDLGSETIDILQPNESDAPDSILMRGP